MENSYKYFMNKDCKYFPCHENATEDFNCLFCYCPMYQSEKCLGSPEFIESRGRVIKDCTNCTFPHNPQNYEKVLSFIRDNM